MYRVSTGVGGFAYHGVRKPAGDGGGWGLAVVTQELGQLQVTLALGSAPVALVQGLHIKKEERGPSKCVIFMDNCLSHLQVSAIHAGGIQIVSNYGFKG